MILEHWIDDDGGTCVFPREHRESWIELITKIGPPPRKCCEIKGVDWADCMAKYHLHMGWEPYVSPSTAANPAPASPDDAGVARQ